MLKPLLACLFAAVFILTVWSLGAGEWRRHRLEAAIAAEPAFVPGELSEVRRDPGSKSADAHVVTFRYEVGGNAYRVDMPPTGSEGVARYRADAAPQIAFARSRPAQAMLKRHYDLRGQNRTAVQSAFFVTAMGLAAGLLAVMVFACVGWLAHRVDRASKPWTAV